MKLIEMNCLLLLLLGSVMGAPTVTFIRSKTLESPQTPEELLTDFKFLGDFVPADTADVITSSYTAEHTEIRPWDFGSMPEDRKRILALLKCKDLMQYAEGSVPEICNQLS